MPIRFVIPVCGIFRIEPRFPVEGVFAYINIYQLVYGCKVPSDFVCLYDIVSVKVSVSHKTGIEGIFIAAVHCIMVRGIQDIAPVQ